MAGTLHQPEKGSLSSACRAETLCRRAGEGGCQHTSFSLGSVITCELLALWMSCKFMDPNTFQSQVETVLNLAPFGSLHTYPCPVSGHTDRNWTFWNLWLHNAVKPKRSFECRSASFRNPRFLSLPFILSGWLLLLNNSLLSLSPSSGAPCTQLAWLCRWCCHSELWHLLEFLAER